MEKPKLKRDLTMQPRVYLAGDPARQPRHGFELLQGGCEEGLRGSEVLEDLLFPGGTNAGQLVEDRAGHLRAAELAVVGQSEAVRFVPNALEKV